MLSKKCSLQSYMYHMIIAMFKEKSKDDIKEKCKLLIVVSLYNEYMLIISPFASLCICALSKYSKVRMYSLTFIDVHTIPGIVLD